MILSSAELRCRMSPKMPDDERLYVTPVLEQDDQLDARQAAFDIRLGTDFVVFRQADLVALDPFQSDADKAMQEAERSGEHRRVPVGGTIVLHPRTSVLGKSLEYVRMPLDLSALVIARSSWGRLGLVVATATYVHPGYTGSLTLELENLGVLPLVLRPGCRLGQMVFCQVIGEVAPFDEREAAKYMAATGPEIGKLHVDRERDRLAVLERGIEAAKDMVV